MPGISIRCSLGPTNAAVARAGGRRCLVSRSHSSNLHHGLASATPPLEAPLAQFPSGQSTGEACPPHQASLVHVWVCHLSCALHGTRHTPTEAKLGLLFSSSLFTTSSAQWLLGRRNIQISRTRPNRDNAQGTCPRPIHCPGRRGAPTDRGAQRATAHSTLTDTRTHSHVRPRTCHTDTHRHTETHPLPHRPHAHAPGHMLTRSYTWTHTDTDTGHRTHEHTGP